MNILIVAATKGEIQPLLKEFQFQGEQTSVYQRQIGNHRIDCLITGVGIHHTAWNMGQLLSKHAYEFALQVGVAGSFSAALPIGSVVRVATDRFGDFGASSPNGFIPAENLGLLPDIDGVIDSGLVNDSPLTNIWLPEWKVSGITVQQVHGDRSSIEAVSELYSPDIESMEGASFLLACRTLGLPCAQIRSISNMVEPRNRSNWNIPLAVDQLQWTIKKIISSLP